MAPILLFSGYAKQSGGQVATSMKNFLLLGLPFNCQIYQMFMDFSFWWWFSFSFLICVLSTESSLALIWISNYAMNFRRVDNMCCFICTKDEIILKIFYLFCGNLKQAFKIILAPEIARIWNFSNLKSSECWKRDEVSCSVGLIWYKILIFIDFK